MPKEATSTRGNHVPEFLRAPPAAISCRSPAPPRCRTASCARWTCRSIDHRGPEFGKLGREVLDGIKTIFKTPSPVIIYPASGTGAWEAALVNTLSPGDTVLMFETGHFATLWKPMAVKLGLKPEFIAGRLARRRRPRRRSRRGCAEDKRARDQGRVRRAQRDLHRAASRRIDEVRKAIDAAGHPALLMVDTISSLGSIDYRARRVGRRRHRRRLAEGPDAAAGPRRSTRSPRRRSPPPRRRSCRSRSGAGTR